jgi:nicotinate dehydrogenase subunit B
MMSATHLSRRKVLEGAGVLMVGLSFSRTAGAAEAVRFGPSAADLSVPVRNVDPEGLDSWLAIARDGNVTVYTGRVDLGTGTETMYGQFVAEELDVPFERILVIMGDSRLTPNQGKTTSSLNVVRGSQPLRIAAAEARAVLVAMASDELALPASELETIDGVVRSKSLPHRAISYGELIGDKRFSIRLELAGKTAEDLSRGVMLKPRAPLKAFKDYKVLGQSIPRVDIPAKVAGTFEYVHNVRIPGMLHGRVVRPPAIGAKLVSIAEDSISGVPEARVVRRNDFLGVVAPREEHAIKAALILQSTWTKSETLPQFDHVYDDLTKAEVVGDEFVYSTGDIRAGLAKGKTRHKATYHFPYQDHAMIGPSCAIADVSPTGATIWSGSQWPQGDRSDIAKMLGLPVENVHLIWREASGSYGRLGCDDAAADAAIMSQLTERPVRVQWMRDDEHVWEPLSPAMTMTVEGAVDENGRITAFDYLQYSPSHSMGEKGNHLAWHLIGGAPGWGRMSGGGANLWYDIPAKRGHAIFVKPWLRGIYLRSPGGLQSVFAYESFISELAALTGIDPLELRVKNTPDRRDQDVLRAVARMSDWEAGKSAKRDRTGSILTGRGIAMGRYGAGESRSALVVDVEVERRSGRVRVAHVCMAFDCGLVLNPDGLYNQVEGGLVQGISRALHEQVTFDRKNVTSANWLDYPILTFAELPDAKLELIRREDIPWGAAGEAGTVATVAAVANAVADAVGKQPRRLPLNRENVLALLQAPQSL